MTIWSKRASFPAGSMAILSGFETLGRDAVIVSYRGFGQAHGASSTAPWPATSPYNSREPRFIPELIGRFLARYWAESELL